MVLDETTEGLSGCRHEILVVRVGYKHGFRPRRLVFFRWIRRKSVPQRRVAYGENEYSFL